MTEMIVWFVVSDLKLVHMCTSLTDLRLISFADRVTHTHTHTHYFINHVISLTCDFQSCTDNQPENLSRACVCTCSDS